MIRRATLDDLEHCVDLGAEFHAYAVWSQIPLNRNDLADFLGRVIEHGAVFLSEDGMVGGVLNPLYFNRAYVTASELFWWARKGGRDLLRAFEQWAHENKVVGVTFSGLADEHAKAIERIFRHEGYVPIETGFYKRIG